jgi:hypothetical protein
VASPWKGNARGALVARIGYISTFYSNGSTFVYCTAAWYSPSAKLLYTYDYTNNRTDDVISLSPDIKVSVAVLEDLGLPGGYRWIDFSSAVPRQHYPVPASTLTIIVFAPGNLTWFQEFVCRITNPTTGNTYLGNLEFVPEAVAGDFGCIAWGETSDSVEEMYLETAAFEVLVSSHLMMEGLDAPAGGGGRRHLLSQELGLSGSSSNSSSSDSSSSNSSRIHQQLSRFHGHINVTSTTLLRKQRRLHSAGTPETIFDVYRAHVNSLLGI